MKHRVYVCMQLCACMYLVSWCEDPVSCYPLS